MPDVESLTLFPGGVLRDLPADSPVGVYRDAGLYGEIIASSLRPFQGTTLQNPDEVLDRVDDSGEGVALWRRIRLQVPTLGGILGNRLDMTMSLPLNWIPGDPDDADSVERTAATSRLWDMIPYRPAVERRALEAILDGVAFTEVAYDAVEVTITPAPVALGESPVDQGDTTEELPAAPAAPQKRREVWQVPARLVDHDPEVFGFDLAGIRFFGGGAPREGWPVSPWQVIVTRSGSAQLFGRGIIREVYPDVYKLDQIDRWGLTALEKQGYPLVQFNIPDSWNDEKIRTALAWATRNQPNWIAVRTPGLSRLEVTYPGKDISVTYLGADQIARIQQLEHSIERVILGASFSSDTSGSFARDRVRGDQRFEKATIDGAVRQGFAEAWRDRLCSLNWPSWARDNWPKPVVDTKATEDLDSWMKNAETASGLGFPLSKKQVATKQGFELPASDEDTLKKPSAPAPVASGFGPFPSMPAAGMPATGGGSRQNGQDNADGGPGAPPAARFAAGDDLFELLDFDEAAEVIRVRRVGW